MSPRAYDIASSACDKILGPPLLHVPRDFYAPQRRLVVAQRSRAALRHGARPWAHGGARWYSVCSVIVNVFDLQARFVMLIRFMRPWMQTTLAPARAGFLALTLGACDGSESPAPPPSPAPTCPGDNQAPLIRTGFAPVCTAVGADPATAPGDWPDPAGAQEPVVYVSPGAGAGTGTRAAPFHDLATALASTPPPATVLLARGTYPLSATVRLSAPVTLRGAGVGDGATTLTSPRGAPAFEVSAADDVSLAVTLARLRVRGDTTGDGGGGDDGTSGVQVVGARTRLTLRDVAFERVRVGVLVDRATLCAQGLSVRRARRAGLGLVHGGAGLVRDFLIRDGDNVGVLADGSVLAMRTGLVANNAREGIVLRGGRSSGTPCAPPDAGPLGGCPPASLDEAGSECPAVPICPDFMAEQRCVANLRVPAVGGVPEIRAEGGCRALSTFEEVTVAGNHVAGLRVERLPPPDDAGVYERAVALAQPGSLVRATRLIIEGTGVPHGETGSGDGLYVGAGARVTLDPNVIREDGGVPGSLLIANARAGALVDGDRTSSDLPSAVRTFGTLRASGAVVRSNRGPGMYVQERACVEALSYGEFRDNAVLGLGVTSGGRVPLIQCEHFINTRTGSLVTERGTLQLADGLSMSEGSGSERDTRISASEFSGNAGYGLVLAGFNASLEGVNRARSNVLGVSIFGSTVLGERGNLEGLNSDTPPARFARGAQAAPPANR